MNDILIPRTDEDLDFEKSLQNGLTKDGIRIDKGAVLTPDYLNLHKRFFENLMDTFSSYPDIYLDMIQNPNMKTELFFYQRIILRSIMRYKDIFVTAPRAFSKSFLTILGMILQCIFIPGTKRFIAAPFKTQSASIAKEKITEIYERWPLIRKEIEGCEIEERPGNFGKDYVELRFKNGSTFMVVGTGDAARGGRKHGGLIDEVRDHDGDELEKVVYPFLNVSRRLPDGSVNENEPNQQRIYMTSAGSKSSYAYETLVDLFENSIINPRDTFVFGCDYKVPVLHGLLKKDYVNKLKMSSAFDEQSFAQEYLSLWDGGSDESWFNFDQLNRHRKIKNPETHEKSGVDPNRYYIISVDVGRFSDQTAVCVFRVNIQSSGLHRATLVNLYVLGRQAETKTFQRQAIDLKKIIQAFNPRNVIIDTNGVGAGFADILIQETVDADGTIYPAYGFCNDDKYKQVQPKNADKILYGIKANAKTNSEMHSNAYTRVDKGLVNFLISDQEAKVALLSTKAGQKMSTEDRVKRLMPHQMTTSLIQEICNLRLKKTGINNDISLEKINTHFPKDKFSSFEYGLWRIKEYEDENARKRKRSVPGQRQLVFFTGG